MNKIVNMNLGGLPFQIDVDAYDRLNAYLIAVKRKFSHMQGSEEIVEDIEARIAEMFQEHMEGSSRKIVSMKDVDHAIEAMGKPEEFDQVVDEEELGTKSANQTYHTGKKLFRDPDNKVLGGVISGITKYFGFENPTWARILIAALPILDFLGTFGISTMFLIFTYIVLWIAIPKAQTATQKMQMRGERINLDSIEKNVSDGVDNVKKNFNSERTRNAGRSLGEILGAIAIGLGKLLLVFGLFIAVLIALALIIAFFAAMFGVGMSAPFLSEYIFGNHWLSWVATIGAFLMLLAIPVFIISLLVKLLFKTKTNMPAIAFGTLGAFIIGLLMTSLTSTSLIKDFSDKSSVEETETLPVNQELTLYGNETEDSWNNGGIGINKSFMTNNVDLFILPSFDSTAWVEVKKLAKGKSKDIAQNRAKALQYNYVVEGNKVIFDEELILGNQVWREQEVDAYLRVPENTILQFDNSIRGVLKYAKFNGVKFYPNTLTNTERWKFADKRLFPVDENGEEIQTEEEVEVENEGEFEWEGAGNLDVGGDSEHVKIKMFGRDLLEIDVTESNQGKAAKVDISIGDKKAIQIEVDEQGDIVNVDEK